MKRGQAVTILLVFLPLMIILCGVIVRTGKTMLIHQQIQNHCNKKILDALAEQGQGLHTLGKLNPTAKKVIDLRRIIDRSLAAGAVTPSLIPGLIAARHKLVAFQSFLASQQKIIMTSALTKSAAILSKKSTQSFQGKVTETFGPANQWLPHQNRNSLKLHVTAEEGYQHEIGCPLTLDMDFDQRQGAKGTINIHTEKFLDQWPGFEKARNIAISCGGHVEMNTLEDKWKAVLIQVVGKPSLKPLL